jgi:hypothetical protein
MPNSSFFIKNTRIPSLGKGGTNYGFYCRIVGYENVERGLLIQIAKMKARTRIGLREAVEYLHKDIQEGPYPQEPWGMDRVNSEGVVVHKGGTLSHSWEVNDVGTEESPEIIFGYNMEKAPYAWYVHEMTSPPYGDVQWTKTVRNSPGPQWLTIGIQRDKAIMLAIIARNASVEGKV